MIQELRNPHHLRMLAVTNRWLLESTGSQLKARQGTRVVATAPLSLATRSKYMEYEQQETQRCNTSPTRR